MITLMRTILLTGASGVVGTSLLPRLRHHQVISLTRNRAVPGATVRGDVAAPGLGLGAAAYRRLAGTVGTVVHCAAVTDFGASDERTAEVNVRGTEHVLAFARDAGAGVLYLSTAFVTREKEAVDAGAPLGYISSKIAAEDRVRECGLPAAIVRPSVVVGDSATGELAPVQGFYAFLRTMLRNRLGGVVPCGADDLVDFVPRDVVADCIAALVDRGATGEYWLTSGERAPSTRRLFELAERAAARHGRRLEPVRMVSARASRRLARMDPVHHAPHAQFSDLLALAVMFDGAEPFPSSLGAIPGGPPAPTAETVDDWFGAVIGYLYREHVPPAGPARTPSARRE